MLATSVFINLLGPIGLGYMLRKTKLLDSNGSASLKVVALKLALPMLIFQKLSDMPQTQGEFLYLLAPSLVITSVYFWITSVLYRRYARGENSHKNTIAISMFSGNHGYLALALFAQVIGPQAIPYVFLYVLLFWPLFLFLGFSYTLIFSEARASVKTKILDALKHAALPIFASLAGLSFSFNRLAVPELVDNFFNLFSPMVVPLLLLCIGSDISLRDLKKYSLKILPLSLLRPFIGLPFALVFIITLSFWQELPNDILRVIFLQCLMPTAFMSVLFAEEIDSDKALLSGIISVGTFAAIFYIPICDFIFQALF